MDIHQIICGRGGHFIKNSGLILTQKRPSLENSMKGDFDENVNDRLNSGCRQVKINAIGCVNQVVIPLLFTVDEM